MTGVSGAGKTRAMHTLEDIGFYCVDNLPPELIDTFRELCEKSGTPRAAVVADIRGGSFFSSFENAVEKLRAEGVSFKVLFLDAADAVLINRYKETRRRHPMSIAEGLPITEAIERERRILKPLQERADYQIDTSLLSTAQHKERICNLFLQGSGAKGAMALTVMSFGFKFGLPKEADIVFDVRCLPNPFYVPELKEKTGLDPEVVDYVMSFADAQQLLGRIEALLECSLPLYVKEGKSALTIAVGCTGGKHRSITFARKIGEYCAGLGYAPSIQHRDAQR